MALSHWTFYTSGGGVPTLVTSPTPPVGPRWLHCAMVSGGIVQYIGIPRAFEHRNIYQGTWRSLIRLSDFSLRSQAGFIFACSQDDMRYLSGGVCYAVMLDYRAVIITPPDLRVIRIVKFDNGITDLAFEGLVIATSPNPTFVNTSTIALEVSWYMVPCVEIRFNVRMGAAIDFSDLVNVTNLTNIRVTSNVPTIAHTLGFACTNWNSNNAHMYLDQTSLEYFT